jgi:hypothetical protein
MKQLGHRAACDGHTQALELLLEAVEWERIAALAHDQMRHETRSVLRAVEDFVRDGRSDNVLAARAHELLAPEGALAEIAGHVLGHRARLVASESRKLPAAAL